MSFRKLWLFRQLEHQNISTISKGIDSQKKSEEYNEEEEEQQKILLIKKKKSTIIPIRCAYTLIS